MDSRLKVFVWDGVFCDWTCGMAVALAYNKYHAIDLIVANSHSMYRNELVNTEPTIHEIPFGAQVSGGG